jgi:serine/threonine protein kinase
MASVWCAEDRILGRTVAVKVLAERFANDDMAMRRFKREARAAARVANHPHVVTIFDVGDLVPERGEIRSRPFIVMEYLAGGTVADAVRVGAVRRQEAVRWIREAASALDHAHARGIVHRDIKPANFLLNRSRVLHVADFGIARLTTEDTISTAGELFGTAAYLSPEQALGREATGASDRYALAVAAFELMAGERPFQAQHFAAQARQHIEDAPPYASTLDRTLPPVIDPVLIQGMAKEPDERFDTAGAFVDALETAISGGIPILDTAVTQRRRTTSRQAASRPARTSKAAAGAGMLAAATTSLGSRRAPAGPPPWTPADSLQKGSFGRRGTGRAIALVALVVVVLGIGAIAVAGIGGSKHPTASASTRVVHHQAAAATAAHRSKPAAKTSSSSTSAASSTPSTVSTTVPQSAEALQLAGHDEMMAGNYEGAIATLKRAISVAAPGSLTYAYGLYDLGRSMVLSGDPAGAVPILEQRLKIPNQTGVVQQMLDQALVASGQEPAPSAPNPPGQGQHKGGPGQGKHGNGSGGAGLTPAQGAPGIGNGSQDNGDGQDGGGGGQDGGTVTTNIVT